MAYLELKFSRDSFFVFGGLNENYAKFKFEFSFFPEFSHTNSFSTFSNTFFLSCKSLSHTSFEF